MSIIPVHHRGYANPQLSSTRLPNRNCLRKRIGSRNIWTIPPSASSMPVHPNNMRPVIYLVR